MALLVAAPGLPAQEVLVAVQPLRVPSKVFQPSREVDVWLPANEGITAPRLPVVVFPDAEEGQFRAALANIQFSSTGS